MNQTRYTTPHFPRMVVMVMTCLRVWIIALEVTFPMRYYKQRTSVFVFVQLNFGSQ